MPRILFLGDIVGRPGRAVLKSRLQSLIQEYAADVVIANGENAAGGAGLDPGTAEDIFGAGVQCITTGNHIWNRKEAIPLLDAERQRILRPLNYPGAPGVGWTRIKTKVADLAVINAIGRVFMTDLVDCPFAAIDKLLTSDLADCPAVFVDFHAEATSEKGAMGFFLDGRVTAVVGTHTHVQTADETILPKGTAFISDVGMCGPEPSIIGVAPEPIIERFRSGRPIKFETAKGGSILCAVVVDYDQLGRALKIQRILERKTETGN